MAAAYALIISGLLAGLIVLGWQTASGLSRASTHAQLYREAHIIGAGAAKEFLSGANPATQQGVFSNGYSYRVVITNERSPSAGLERLVAEVLWETDRPLPANATTASHTVTLVAARLAP